ncbi:hypothetical protein VNO80_01300 [Phaseolus coccineus]|uniref:Uncharacterized protein n=1 Tax=Phaseolus coccineus TaxID=3886 RepID=A0AAN9RSM2_PHACN
MPPVEEEVLVKRIQELRDRICALEERRRALIQERETGVTAVRGPSTQKRGVVRYSSFSISVFSAYALYPLFSLKHCCRPSLPFYAVLSAVFHHAGAKAGEEKLRQFSVYFERSTRTCLALKRKCESKMK